MNIDGGVILKVEHIIYVVEVVLVVFLLIRFVPKNKIREAHVAYLFKLVITWLIGLAVAEYRLIEYPIRLFPYANKASFLFEYFLYPAICTLFVVNYPEKKRSFAKFMYYFYYCTALTIIEVIQERYTDILEYINWNWAITWATFFITFYMARKYNQWFFKNIKMIDK
jgi:hypothetical protein